MTTLTYTPEQAQALSQQYDLLVHETANLPYVEDLALYIHQERVNRVYEWTVAEGIPAPLPCCPEECEDCGEQHPCWDFDDGVCLSPYPGGMEWSEDDVVLVQIPFEVIWANDESITEAYIAKAVQKSKDFIQMTHEQVEMMERARMAELQHKYGEV